MPLDIYTKAKPSAIIINGSIITAVDKQGNIEKINPVINDAPTGSGVEVRLTNRWDDPTYYTA